MTNSLKLFICITLFLSTVNMFFSQEYYNQYGMLIKNGDLEISYSHEELERARIQYENEANAVLWNPKQQDDTSSTNCEILWQDALLGHCIGEHDNLISYDVDNDGTPELIVNGSTWADLTELGYWYILKYDL